MRTATLCRPWLLASGALLAVAAIAWSMSPRTATTEVAKSPEPAVSEAPVAHAAPSVLASVPATKPVSRRNVSRSASRKVEASRAPDVAPGEAGMRAYLDPETGMIGPPNAEQRRSIPSPTSTIDFSKIPVQRMPDGSIMVENPGLTEEYVIMTIGADGKRRMTCVSDPSLVPGAPASTPTPVEE
jgi:hypothetical protein